MVNTLFTMTSAAEVSSWMPEPFQEAEYREDCLSSTLCPIFRVQPFFQTLLGPFSMSRSLVTVIRDLGLSFPSSLPTSAKLGLVLWSYVLIPTGS